MVRTICFTLMDVVFDNSVILVYITGDTGSYFRGLNINSLTTCISIV